MFRVASLLLAVGFISAPAFAQGPPGGPPGGAPGGSQSLASQVAALAARVAKLEGDIVASDLAGTYAFRGLVTSMTAFRPATQWDPAHNATISTEAFRATLTLAADFTGSVAGFSCEGSKLTQGSWALTGTECSGEEPQLGVTWAYEDGVITITFLDDGDEIPFSVALGGRLLIMNYAPFHPSDPSSEQFLFIATRLK
jgi:hypothetical protein